MARRKGHVYILDNKTGELYSNGGVNDNGLDLFSGLWDSVDDAVQELERTGEEYENDPESELGKERLMSLDVYKDGQLVMEGSEIQTQQEDLFSF